ncbi:hypothetical protein G7046_g4996 [Stylonectria norvegica]|nr:hypothetical protein G7046_g4996 [Stylonectria norvegica]
MQFFSAAALLAFAASAFAQTADFDPIYTPTSGEVVQAGASFQITWKAPAKYQGETIAISLIGGATQNTQVPLLNIASGVDNGANTYTWSVPSTLGAENFYGLVFKLESNPDVFQYSNPFKIDGGVPKTSSSATTTLTASTGVKTISLSSSTVTTAVNTSSIPAVTSIVDATTTVPCNNTVPAPQTKTIVPAPGYNCTTLVSAITKSQGGAAATGTGGYVVPAPTGTGPVIVISGATRMGAGSLAVVGGLVLAAFAL